MFMVERYWVSGGEDELVTIVKEENVWTGSLGQISNISIKHVSNSINTNFKH